MRSLKIICFKFITKLGHFCFKGFSVLNRRYQLISAKEQGMKVGANTKFVGTQYFGTEPFLISIGESCLITDNVRFITHDGAIQIPLMKNGAQIEDVYGKHSIFGKICVGNNVFIGVGAIILPDTVLGNHTIIGAGSVVKGVFKDSCVVAGNPAKIICSVDEYFSKNKEKLIDLTKSFKDSRKISILEKLSVDDKNNKSNP